MLRNMRRASPDPQPDADASHTVQDEAAVPGARISDTRDGDEPTAVRLDTHGSEGWNELLTRLARRRSSDPLIELDEVGRGGMGRVLSVMDPDLRRRLAMKVMDSPHDDTHEETRHRRTGRFLEEAQVTAQLDHPGIAPVHQLGINEEGDLFFTMKFVRGRTLKDILPDVWNEESGWTLPRFISILLRAVEALAFAHRKGVIHRDLKPSNIMVGRYGETYVMDWGLSKVIGYEERKDIRPRTETITAESFVRSDRREREDLETPLETMDGDVIGTPAYMAPEQAAGRLEEIGPHSDVYAVGAILYHALARQAPYLPPDTRVSPYLVLRFVLEGPPPRAAKIRPDSHPELVAVCEKAMSRNPARRYASMEELADELRAFLEGRVVQAYAGGAIEELRKWVGRNRTVAATLAGSLVALALITTFFLLSLREETIAAHASATIARQKTKEAEQSRAVAERARRHAEATLHLRDIADLRVSMESLWPVSIEDRPAIQAWFRRLREIEGYRDRYETEAATTTDSEERELFRQVLTALGGFSDGEGADPELRAKRSRLEMVADLPAVTVDAHREEWDRTIAEIADATDSAAYGGLVITPQVGLVPIGRDPDSGLFEFWHVLSGDRPVRDGDGRLVIEDDMGVVLVLIPGGTFLMGAQPYEPAEPGYDEMADHDEYPPHEITLAPFLLSKFELTQRQWWILTETRPGLNVGPRNPVERVSWDECVAALARVGMVLPTEAEWEYAARAGTATPWFVDPSSLDRYANVADLSALRVADEVDGHLNDGFARIAPVGSFLPNPFGLHDTAGNVDEWCHDQYLDYRITPVGPRGHRTDEVSPPRGKTLRGGSYLASPTDCRTWARSSSGRRQATDFIGVRPARLITAWQ